MINVTLQNVVTEKMTSSSPSEALLSKWANAANLTPTSSIELTIRLVNKLESAELNNKYRDKNSATNILAFPFEVDENVDINLLGDLVICSQIVNVEAQQQAKTELEHWAHIVIHGVLHLQGYDHINNEQAQKMENLEIKILNTLGYCDPYRVNEL